jgi:hypothetical protein
VLYGLQILSELIDEGYEDVETAILSSGAGFISSLSSRPAFTEPPANKRVKYAIPPEPYWVLWTAKYRKVPASVFSCE